MKTSESAGGEKEGDQPVAPTMVKTTNNIEMLRIVGATGWSPSSVANQ